jgi:transcriptional regulator with XRE-family HTH domain
MENVPVRAVRFLVLKRLWELRLKLSDLEQITGISADHLAPIESGVGGLNIAELDAIASCLQLTSDAFLTNIDPKSVAQEYPLLMDIWMAKKNTVHLRRTLKARQILQGEFRRNIAERRRLLIETQSLIKQTKAAMNSSRLLSRVS